MLVFVFGSPKSFAPANGGLDYLDGDPHQQLRGRNFQTSSFFNNSCCAVMWHIVDIGTINHWFPLIRCIMAIFFFFAFWRFLKNLDQIGDVFFDKSLGASGAGIPFCTSIFEAEYRRPISLDESAVEYQDVQVLFFQT